MRTNKVEFPLGTNDWNPECKSHWQGIRTDPVPGILVACLIAGSNVMLHGAIRNDDI